MSKNYKIREVRIELASGVTVIADIESVASLKELIKHLKENKLLDLRVQPTKPDKKMDTGVLTTGDTPADRLEMKADLGKGTLGQSKVLAYKDDIPQLLRPGMFSAVSDATVVLLFAIETGLRKPSVDYESFKGLYEAQNIKSGTPLSLLLNNLKNSGYIDKKAYDADRTLRLTAKGEKKAIEVLKSLSPNS